jgi:acetyl-CoA C-acetyltransferase
MLKEVVIIGAARTPVGKVLGSLASLEAPELGAIAIKAALERANVPLNSIEEVIMGNVLQAGLGQAPARQAAIKAGIPPEVPCFTVNKVCGSGLKAVMLAADTVQLNDGVVVAGGMESMSNAPFAVKEFRKGRKYGNTQFIDLMVYDGLWDVYNDVHMGNLAEYTARKSGITREEQDRYAYESHMKAIRAQDEGKFKLEIVPVEIKGRKGEVTVVDTDEGPRRDTSLEKLAKLPPAFEKEGTVTAGNAPGLNDGAAALVVTSMDKAKELGAEPLAVIRGYTAAGTDPRDLFYAPIYAVRKLMKKLGISDIDYFDLIEINEAFAAQTLADGKELGWDWSKVNVHGGAIALGHPIGASGARILVTLIYAMKDRGAKTGLATLCLGGGNAVAMAIEMP